MALDRQTIDVLESFYQTVIADLNGYIANVDALEGDLGSYVLSVIENLRAVGYTEPAGALQLAEDAVNAFSQMVGRVELGAPFDVSVRSHLNDVADQISSIYSAFLVEVSAPLSEPLPTTEPIAPPMGTGGLSLTDFQNVLNTVARTIGDINEETLRGASSISSYYNSLINTVSETVTNITNEAAGILPSTTLDFEGLTSHIGNWGEGVAGWLKENIIDPWLIGFAKAWENFASWFGFDITEGSTDRFKSRIIALKLPTTTDEIDHFVEITKDTLDKPDTIPEFFTSLLLRVSLGFTAIAAALEPLIETARQRANMKMPVEPLDPVTSIDAIYQGIITKEKGVEEASKTGVSKEDFEIMFQRADYTPSLSEAASWRARGLISDNEYNIFVRKNHAAHAIGEINRINNIRPVSGSSALNVWGRLRTIQLGFLNGGLNYNPPPEIPPMYRTEQVDATQSEYDWVNHFNIPPPSWFADAAFRGLRPPQDVELSAIAANFPDEIAKQFLELSRPLLPARIVTTLFSKKIVNETWARAHYAKLGFSKDDIDTFIVYAVSMRKDEEQAVDPELAKLALNAAVYLYEEHAISRDQIYNILLAHKYSPAAAKLQLEYIDLKIAAEDRKEYAVDIVNQVDLGIITITQGLDALHAGGYNNREILRYQKQMNMAKAAKVKQPTEAHIKDMYNAGYIGVTEVENYYMREGFTGDWVPMLTALIVAPQPKPEKV